MSSKMHSFNDRLVSPLRSVSYHGDFLDFLSNPAALPLRDDNQGSFAFRINGSDDIPFANFSKKTGYINNRIDEISVSFAGRNIAFTANLGTSFERKSEPAHFDIFSNVDIEIDWGFAFPYVSVGMSIKGGNSLIRNDKPIDSVFDAISNALFSPFERYQGRERFSLGGGLLVYFDNFSIGLNIEKILALDSSSEMISNWETVGKSTAFSFAANGDKFTKDGDLHFLLPRASISFSEFSGFRYTFSVKGDVTLQFLPDCNMAIGLGYREKDHGIFSFKTDNGNLDFFIKGQFWDFSVTFGASFDTKTFSSISPFVGFSYIG